MPTFNPSIQPDYGSTGEIEPRVLVAQFGDGYSQRTRDGINNLTRRYRLTWSAIPTADADSIEAFMLARAGAESFDYAPPGSVSRKWITRGAIQRGHVGFGVDSISIEIQEVPA